MSYDIKLAVVGGDRRQLDAADYLARRGFEVAVYGFDRPGEDIGRVATRCDDPADAVHAARAVILPMPVSSDGATLFCPLCDRPPLPLSDLLDECRDAVILGGRLTPDFRALCAARGQPCFDYYDRETVKVAMAVPTAEGAAALAIEALPITLRDARILISGYGRIGRVLAPLIRSFGASVAVFARRPEVRDRIAADGFRPVAPDGLNAAVCGADLIFNTVPAPLFDAASLMGAARGTPYLELASAPGGLDAAAAGDAGLTVIPAAGLPGRFSPVTAGRIIGDAVGAILRENGVIA